MPTAMKILYLSKALVVGAYQTKMEAIAAEPDIQLVAAIPPSWKDERGEMRLEPAHLEGYELRVLPMALNGSFHLHFYPTMGRLLDEVKPDLLHIDEEPYNLATFHAGWLAQRRKIPFLFFTWQNLLRHYPQPFRWMEQWNYRHAAYAIAGNSDARAVLQEKGYEGETTIIPQFGVDLRLFKMKSLTPEPDRPFVLGYAGRFVEEKGLHYLLEALAGMQELSWRFLARGSGPAREALEAQARQAGIAERVSFLPPLPSSEMHRFYHEIDLLVLPSLTRANWKEQFGRVLIEAMASGVVVVGSDSGEIPQVMGDAGVVVPEGESEALRAALCCLIDDPSLRRNLASAGRRRVLARFTQEAIARQTVEVYQEILHRQRA